MVNKIQLHFGFYVKHAINSLFLTSCLSIKSLTNSCSRKLEWLPFHWMPQHNNPQRFSPLCIDGWVLPINHLEFKLNKIFDNPHLLDLSLQLVSHQRFMSYCDTRGCLLNNLKWCASRVFRVCLNNRWPPFLLLVSEEAKRRCQSIQMWFMVDFYLYAETRFFHITIIFSASVLLIISIFVYAYLLRICFIFHIFNGW